MISERVGLREIFDNAMMVFIKRNLNCVSWRKYTMRRVLFSHLKEVRKRFVMIKKNREL